MPFPGCVLQHIKGYCAAKELVEWQGHTRKALITRKNVRNVTLCKIKLLLSVSKTTSLERPGVCFLPRPPSGQHQWHEVNSPLSLQTGDLHGHWSPSKYRVRDLPALSGVLGPCRAAGMWSLQNQGHTLQGKHHHGGKSGFCRDWRHWAQGGSLQD